MEHLDIVCGREGGRMSRMWRKRRSSEVFRRESVAQGPIIDGEPWLEGDLKEGGILVAGETVPLSTDEK